MKNFIFAVAVVLLLCNAGGCGTTRQNMEMDNQTEDETAVSSPVTDIVTELAGVDWKKGLLSEIPAYTGRGSLIDCIQSDRVGSVEIEQVPSEDLERYATSLNKAGYQGNLTVIEGAELRSGRYHREENGRHPSANNHLRRSHRFILIRIHGSHLRTACAVAVLVVCRYV